MNILVTDILETIRKSEIKIYHGIENVINTELHYLYELYTTSVSHCT
jgi:hypothetical protein